MKLERLPWSGKGEDPNKLRVRRILRAHRRRRDSPERYVVEMTSEITGAPAKSRSWYDATDAHFTHDPKQATLFCDRDVARAVLSVFTSKKVSLRTCKTRIVKGVRVPVGLGGSAPR